jgi:hypothetical protein
LAESPKSLAKQRKRIREVVDAHRHRPLGELLNRYEFPRTDLAAFYAQSYSVVEFLVELGGQPRFLHFVVDAATQSCDAAVRRHYEYGGVRELEKAWLDWVAGKPITHDQAAAPTPPRFVKEFPSQPPTPPLEQQEPARTIMRSPQIPVGPAPIQAVVKLDKDKTLIVFKPTVAYLPRKGAGDHGLQVTYYEQVPVVSEIRYQLGEVRVFDMKGQTIDPQALPRLFKVEALALLAADGRPVDPLHLRLYKDDTLLFVLPGQMAAVPPPAPAAPVAAEPARIPAP